MRTLSLPLCLFFLWSCSHYKSREDIVHKEIAKKNNQFRKIATGGKVFHEKSGYLFDPNDTSCDGYPILAVETMEGTCLGMVLARDNAIDLETDRSFIKPRTIVQIPGTEDFLLLDMGGWKSDNGRLFHLKREIPNEPLPQNNDYGQNPYEIKLLRYGMDTPHGLSQGPEGFFYLGEKDKIVRFNLEDNEVVDWEVVVSGLPAYKGHMHPLTQFRFDPISGDLFINSGAPSDHCYVPGDDEGEGDYKSCPESEKDGMGAIYRVPYSEFDNLPIEGIKSQWLLARGLRNSMAMAVSPAGYLLQGENGRDFPEFEEPYEEINVINLYKTKNDEGKVYHYGWPYCYNFSATSPEWNFEEANNYGKVKKRFRKPVDCTNTLADGIGVYQAPYALMPPHVAPLDMGYYEEKNVKSEKGIEALEDHLLMTWHGHQPTGNRLVAYPHNREGLPILETHSKAYFNVDKEGGCTVKNEFKPHGGLVRHASYKEVISGWSKIKNLRPEGTPVGFTVAEDGSIWIVEDKDNRSIVRLAKYEGQGHKDDCDENSSREYKDPKINLLAWRDYLMKNEKQEERFRTIKNSLIAKSCVGCHGDLKINDLDKSEYSTLDFLVKNEWVIPSDSNRSKFYGAIAHLEAFTPMPPADKDPLKGTVEGERLISLVEDWISDIPENLNESIKKIKIVASGRRNFRNSPTTRGSTVCGQVSEGDLLYADLSKSQIRENNGYKWVKLFLVPNHTRLQKECEYPKNGVFYMALGKIGSSDKVITEVL